MKNTIKSSREIDRLFRTGKRASSHHIVALIEKIPEERDQTGRVTFVAGKKLGNAPIRNRSKRVLRETARFLGAPWPGYDVILIARNTTAQIGPQDLRDTCRMVLLRAGLPQEMMQS